MPNAQHPKHLESHVDGEATWKAYNIEATAEQLPVTCMLLALAVVMVPPLKKGFFGCLNTCVDPGPRVPGSSQARPRLAKFREWRAPDTMRTLGDLPDAAAAAAPRPGAVPGILAPSQAFWYRPRHSGTLVFALWQCAGQAGRLAAIPSNLAVSSTVSWSILATCRFVSHVGGHAARGRCTRHSGTLSRALWRRPRLPGGFLAASRARPRAVLGGTEV